MTPPIQFDNTYSALPERFFTRTRPTAVRAPRLIECNALLAEQLGIDEAWLASEEGVRVVAGNAIPEGAEPIAMAYAGHQFGSFVPQLGDGRAILLGEVMHRDGARRDIHLKGAGRTPFSRGGDGRAAVGPVLREYILSEAMAALGLPTTRTLAAVTTGEHVAREILMPGAVLARVAHSHVRVGTFQYFAARRDVEALRVLADYVIARHYPDAAADENPYAALLQAVIRSQAGLIARWLLIGFVHGVMNTDNMSIAGETIDYGPCAFMDHYDPRAVWSSIDRGGRYAYMNQPLIGEWNLARFAECLLPLLDDRPEAAVEQGNQALSSFVPLFEGTYYEGLRRKIGLIGGGEAENELAKELLGLMAASSADFTLTFRRLSEASVEPAQDADLRGLFIDPPAYDEWARRWRGSLASQGTPLPALRDQMLRVNPAYIPRNHRVEETIAAGIEGDFAPFRRLLDVLSRPYEEQPEHEEYRRPPQEHERVLQTFCGT